MSDPKFHPNVHFGTVEKALEFVQEELQKRVDQNNTILIDIEKTGSQLELLKNQEEDYLT